MRDTMTVIMDNTQGSLLRVLGMIERRGWRVTSMSMEPCGPQEQTMTVDLERLPWHAGSLEVLSRHVSKLICVHRIADGPAQAESPAPASLSAAASPTSPAPAAPAPVAAAAAPVRVGATS